MKNTIRIIIILLLASGNNYAQQGTASEAKEVLQRLADRYRAATCLSFNVSYYYATEEAPAVYIDSLQGSFKMNGNHYWYEIAGTESLYSDQYAVVLYKEDKMMYLAKPAANMANPVSSLDSFLKADKYVTCHVEHEKKFSKLVLDFIGKGPCKRAEYLIDNQTGFIARMRSLVKSELLYDPAVLSQVENNDSWSVVEMRFDNYREKSFDDKALDVAKYFKKEGKEYITVAPYETYKIFIGTPNL